MMCPSLGNPVLHLTLAVIGNFLRGMRRFPCSNALLFCPWYCPFCLSMAATSVLASCCVNFGAAAMDGIMLMMPKALIRLIGERAAANALW